MTDRQLLKIVTSFRKGILGKQSPVNKCYMVTLALQGYLNAFCEIFCKPEEAQITFDAGENIYLHWYLRLSDGRIIDATASQFNHLSKTKMPEIYFGELPDNYAIIHT